MVTWSCQRTERVHARSQQTHIASRACQASGHLRPSCPVPVLDQPSQAANMTTTPPPSKDLEVEASDRADQDQSPIDEQEGMEARETAPVFDFEVKEQDRWLPIANGEFSLDFCLCVLLCDAAAVGGWRGRVVDGCCTAGWWGSAGYLDCRGCLRVQSSSRVCRLARAAGCWWSSLESIHWLSLLRAGLRTLETAGDFAFSGSNRISTLSPRPKFVPSGVRLVARYACASLLAR